MLTAITAAAKAAAPHVGSAALQGAKALGGFAVSVKTGTWAKQKGFSALVELDEAVGTGKAAAKQVRESKNVTQVSEQIA